MQVQKRLWDSEPVANWDNSAFEAAFVMTLVTGSEATREPVRNFVNLYIQADGTRGITCALFHLLCVRTCLLHGTKDQLIARAALR